MTDNCQPCHAWWFGFTHQLRIIIVDPLLLTISFLITLIFYDLILYVYNPLQLVMVCRASFIKLWKASSEVLAEYSHLWSVNFPAYCFSQTLTYSLTWPRASDDSATTELQCWLSTVLARVYCFYWPWPLNWLVPSGKFCFRTWDSLTSIWHFHK